MIILKVFTVIFCLFSIFLCVQCYYDIPEGEPCTTDGNIGTCANIFRCLSSVVDLRAKKLPTICSYQGSVPVVCCTDCKLVNDTRLAVLDKVGAIYMKSGQKAHDKCIDYVIDHPNSCPSSGKTSFWDPFSNCTDFAAQSVIAAVGGSDAERGQYPHMALLGYGSEKEVAQWLCGGTVISERFVLTAAHCLSASSLGPVRFIALGILKRSDPIELWHHYTVTRIITHPEFKSPSKYHDIALLQTDRPITFSTTVYPACLDFETAFGSYGNAIATGWGALGNRKQLADTLQEVRLQEYSDEQCGMHYPPHRLLQRGYDHNTQMCYGDETVPRDTCEGDSGGPLQVKSPISLCIFTVIGVTSYGRPCGHVGDSGMYTRVRAYIPWIESHVW